MLHLFFRETDAAQEPILSRSTTLPLGLLFGPTVLVLALLRLLQHAWLKTIGMRELGPILAEAAPPPFFIIALVIGLGWWTHRTWPYIQPFWIATGTVILGAGLLLWAALLLPPWVTAWLSAEAYQVLRWDLLVLLVLALCFAVLLEAVRGWARVLTLAMLHLLVPFLLLLPIFELGVIQAMGSPMDWSVLSYSIRHLDELAPVLASEIGPAQIGLLALPLAVTLVPAILWTLPAVRRWMHDGPAATPQRAWQPVVVALPLALILMLLPATPLPPSHSTISYAGMMNSMLTNDTFEPHHLTDLATAEDPAFYTQDLRFVQTEETRRLNVVVIILESIRSRSTTPYNPRLATTPFLDTLAQRSLLVENMYGIITYTNKALVPILAGVYPELGRDIIEAKPGAVPATGLPTLLRPHGYEAAFFTPATMSFENKDQILRNLGFEDIYGDAAYQQRDFHKVNYFGLADHVMLEPSMAWVDAVTAQKHPFFLSYLTITSHHPYETPPAYGEKPFDTTDPKYNAYLNALHYTDTFLKDLFDAFAQRGLIDSTLFVILADHGEAFNEHGESVHGDVIWDEAVQVPALLYNPVLFPEGGRITGNRSHIDVMPTIADALGFQLEGGLYPGFSLLGPVPNDRPVYHSARDGNRVVALRQDSLKFFYYNRRQPMRVFDTRNDPLERHDIAAEIDPDLLKSAEVKLLLWRRSVQQVYHNREENETHLALR